MPINGFQSRSIEHSRPVRWLVPSWGNSQHSSTLRRVLHVPKDRRWRPLSGRWAGFSQRRRRVVVAHSRRGQLRPNSGSYLYLSARSFELPLRPLATCRVLSFG